MYWVLGGIIALILAIVGLKIDEEHQFKAGFNQGKSESQAQLKDLENQYKDIITAATIKADAAEALANAAKKTLDDWNTQHPVQPLRVCPQVAKGGSGVPSRQAAAGGPPAGGGSPDAAVHGRDTTAVGDRNAAVAGLLRDFANASQDWVTELRQCRATL